MDRKRVVYYDFARVFAIILAAATAVTLLLTGKKKKEEEEKENNIKGGKSVNLACRPLSFVIIIKLC